MLALRMRPLVCLTALGALLSAGGCKRRGDGTDAPPQQPPAMRAATSFVHCVEAGKAQCVGPSQASTGWNALYLLSWLGSGSPVAILDSLPGELAAHGQPRAMQGRLVDEVERYAPAMRGAECDAERAEPMEPIIEEAARSATERLERLGLLRGSMQATIGRLAEDAHRELVGGYLVHMGCAHDPYRVVVAVRTGEQDRQTVVGMTTLWPEHLGGQLPDRDAIEARLRSQGLGLATAAAPIVHNAIDPWLPFPVEEL
jgi:hypothetical protein